MSAKADFLARRTTKSLDWRIYKTYLIALEDSTARLFLSRWKARRGGIIWSQFVYDHSELYRGWNQGLKSHFAGHWWQWGDEVTMSCIFFWLNSVLHWDCIIVCIAQLWHSIYSQELERQVNPLVISSFRRFQRQMAPLSGEGGSGDLATPLFDSRRRTEETDKCAPWR